MSFESCGVLPRIVTDLKEAREELQTTGAVIFEHIDCTVMIRIICEINIFI